jgi:hypothetical protein
VSWRVQGMEGLIVSFRFGRSELAVGLRNRNEAVVIEYMSCICHWEFLKRRCLTSCLNKSNAHDCWFVIAVNV